MSLFAELKRRNVFRVGVAYLLLGWVVLQAADFALDLIDAPNWIIQVFFIAGLAGLPVALFFAWAFEITPEGIKRESEVDRSRSITPRTGRRLDRAIIVFLALALALVLGERFFQADGKHGGATRQATSGPPEGRGEAPDAANETKSVAVLAFENMSTDAENEYFADGISEEILNVLSGLDDLRVIARTSAFSFKDSGATVAEIAEKLDVGYVVEGSVRKAGNRVRVTAQLIESGSESNLWSDVYDRDLDDIFAVQDEIARAIAEELQVRLTPDQRRRLVDAPTDNIEAYNQYLLGRQLWHSRNIHNLRASAQALSEAVALEPEFAEAWAALADALVLIPEYDPLRSTDTIPAARDAVNRALELKPELPQALVTRGYLRFMHDYDWENAEKDLLRALDLDPEYPTAHQFYGELISVRYRDVNGALAQFMKAAELDPLAPIMWHVSGWTTVSAGRPEESLRYFQRALDLNPNMQFTYSNLSLAYALLGQYDLAREVRDGYFEVLGVPAPDGLTLVDALEDPTRRTAYLESLEQSNEVPDGALGKAMQYAVLGDFERALDNLELGLQEGDAYAIHANRVQFFDPLRDDPRFQAHLAKMNLWPPPEEG